MSMQEDTNLALYCISGGVEPEEEEQRNALARGVYFGAVSAVIGAPRPDQETRKLGEWKPIKVGADPIRMGCGYAVSAFYKMLHRDPPGAIATQWQLAEVVAPDACKAMLVVAMLLTAMLADADAEEKRAALTRICTAGADAFKEVEADKGISTAFN